MIKFLLFIFSILSISAQEIFLPDFLLGINIGSLSADGEARFIRGTRKVVSTDMLNTTSFSLKFGATISSRNQLIFTIRNAKIRYQIHEDYSGGLMIHSSSDFLMTTYNIEIKHYFYLSSYKIYGSFNVGYVDINNDLNVFSEEYLNPLPEDQIIVYPYKYIVHDYFFGMGFEIGFEFEIFSNLNLGASASYYISKLKASLENDPEDDGVDINSSINPLSLDFGFIYFF